MLCIFVWQSIFEIFGLYKVEVLFQNQTVKIKLPIKPKFITPINVSAL
jgi:hypothetical protein